MCNFSKISEKISGIFYYSQFRRDRKHLLYHKRTRLSLITIFREARCTYAMHLRQDEIISTAKSIFGSDNTDLIATEPNNLQS